MARSKSNAPAEVVQIFRRCLESGVDVKIDGLGTFCRAGASCFEFVPCGRPRVFLAYVEEDGQTVDRIYDTLERHGFTPWMDRRRLLPGQNWPRAIERAISISDYFIACFSSSAVSKRGQFQAELRYAMDCAAKHPLDEVYFIPVRLDTCTVPEQIRRTIQYVDLFPSFEKGMRRVIRAMRRRMPFAKAS